MILRRERGEHALAGLLAATACLGADAAMLHAVRSVVFTLVAAGLADYRTGLQQGARDGYLECGLSCQDAHRRRADVGAVEIEPDAVDTCQDLRLSEAGVGAGATGLRAVVTGVNAGNERIAINRRLAWLCAGHRVGVTHDFIPFP